MNIRSENNISNLPKRASLCKRVFRIISNLVLVLLLSTAQQFGVFAWQQPDESNTMQQNKNIIINNATYRRYEYMKMHANNQADNFSVSYQ